ncbi:MAG TPA: tripartite tricarboxylate transporter substrate binding protein [Oribacterium sp.]|nr:tripartite tricarboxylate transporter substrate binding protein [Oribacterium sp.]
MKKRLLSALLVGSMALGLVACGSSSTPSSTTAADTKAAEAAGTTTAAGAATETSATDWKPSGPISLVLPAGAGGDTDLSARIFAQYAKEATGADFVVVNASGASGSVAANQVLSAANDGLTVLYGHNLVNVANVAGITDYDYTAFTLGPTFAKNDAQGLYVNPDKYKSLDEFIEAAKANPGKLKACTEVGAYTYYELLKFEQVAGIDLDLVDVGSNSDKVTAMLSGQVDMMPGAFVNTKDYLDAGQFICVGIPTEERSELMPDVPTLKEQGIDIVYPDLDYSFYFPAGTDDAVIKWFENTTKTVDENEKCQEDLKNMEINPYYLSAADSVENDKNYLATFKEIAASVEK